MTPQPARSLLLPSRSIVTDFYRLHPSTKALLATTTNIQASTGRAGPFSAIREIVVQTYSRVLDDGLSPQEALDEAAEKANEELANYNSFFE